MVQYVSIFTGPSTGDEADERSVVPLVPLREAEIETCFVHTLSYNHVRNPKRYDRSPRYSNSVGNATTRVTVTLPETNPTVAGSYEAAQTPHKPSKLDIFEPRPLELKHVPFVMYSLTQFAKAGH